MASRRSFLAGLLLGTLAVAAGTAHAGGQSEGGPDLYGAEHLQSSIPLKTDALGRLRVDRILILTDRGAFAADLTSAVYPRNEDRLGFPQDIPIIGKLFQPTIRERDLDPRARIGRVYGIDDVLVVETRRRSGGSAQGTVTSQRLDALAESRPTSAAPLVLPVTGVPVRTVSTVNDRWSFHVRGNRFHEVGSIASMPLLTAIPSLAPAALGDAFAKDPDMILLVRPSIVNNWR
jgi:hypothetical protein